MTEVTFKRGEVRKLSIDLVNKNVNEPFETVVDLTMEAFGWTRPQARGHVRWLVRKGLAQGNAAWPKRARKDPSVRETPVSHETNVEVVEKTEDVKEVAKVGMNKSMKDLAKKLFDKREAARKAAA